MFLSMIEDINRHACGLGESHRATVDLVAKAMDRPDEIDDLAVTVHTDPLARLEGNYMANSAWVFFIE